MFCQFQQNKTFSWNSRKILSWITLLRPQSWIVWNVNSHLKLRKVYYLEHTDFNFFDEWRFLRKTYFKSKYKHILHIKTTNEKVSFDNKKYHQKPKHSCNSAKKRIKYSNITTAYSTYKCKKPFCKWLLHNSL